LNALGDASRNLGNYGAAASYYEESLRIRPRQVEIRLGLARASRFGGNRARALQALAEGLRADPGSALLNQEVIALVSDLGPADVDSAAPALDQIVRVAPAGLRREYAESLLAAGTRLRKASAGPEQLRK